MGTCVRYRNRVLAQHAMQRIKDYSPSILALVDDCTIMLPEYDLAVANPCARAVTLMVILMGHPHAHWTNIPYEYEDKIVKICQDPTLMTFEVMKICVASKTIAVSKVVRKHSD